MKTVDAYKIIAKHIFIAYRKYEGESILVLADDIEEAQKKAVEVFGLSLVVVRPVKKTDDAQVYRL